MAAVGAMDGAGDAADNPPGPPGGFPFVEKKMTKSNCVKTYWLGLPSQFCDDHLPNVDTDMTLQDEDGKTWVSKFLRRLHPINEKGEIITHCCGLSAGWVRYSKDHKLAIGDVVTLTLVEPTKFKMHIIKAADVPGQDRNVNAEAGDDVEEAVPPDHVVEEEAGDHESEDEGPDKHIVKSTSKA